MTSFYESLCAEIGRAVDSDLLTQLKTANEEKLAALEEAIEDSEKNFGETEQKEALQAKAEYLCRIGSKVRASSVCVFVCVCVCVCVCVARQMCRCSAVPPPSRKLQRVHFVLPMRRRWVWATGWIWCSMSYVWGCSTWTMTSSHATYRKHSCECHSHDVIMTVT